MSDFFRTQPGSWAEALFDTGGDVDPYYKRNIGHGLLRRAGSMVVDPIANALPVIDKGMQGQPITAEDAAALTELLADYGVVGGFTSGLMGRIPKNVFHSMPGITPDEKAANFKRWFGDSKVVDESGQPLTVYHGTGSDITEFKEEFTGQGNDQFGSGFYFTTDPNEANAYTTSKLRNPRTGEYMEKPGGTDNPTVVNANLSIENPIRVSGNNLNDADIELTHEQARDIISQSPDIMHPEESPLGDWIDTYWEDGPQDWMIDDVAQHYTGPSLMSLEGDFFDDNATAFRKAINSVTGYDGVVQDFGNGKKHFIAWFPNQIKSIHNRGTYDPNDPNILRSFAPMPVGLMGGVNEEK